MKTIIKYLILSLLVGSFLFPIIGATAVIEPEQTERRFRLGITGTPSENWDVPITSGYGNVDLWMEAATTEKLFAGNVNYDAGLTLGVDKADTWYPILATSWDIDFWPEEMNSKGFINRGGAANVTFTLREGVTFHDGSAWNATAAKWNIDRVFIISGNLTGNGDLRNRDTYWVDVLDWTDYFTPSWNMSSFVGSFGGYDGIYNPNPFVGGVLYAPYEKFPVVNRVVITDDKASGGQIRVEFNEWNNYYTNALGNVDYISMETYDDYWDRGIYGFDNDDPLYPDHMIGTGPWIYVDMDETGSPGGGTLAKNPNYWNRTALEAEGFFAADFIDIITWPADTLGIESRNTALMTGAVDYALDNFFTPVDYQDVLSEPNLVYHELPVSDYITSITLNCINETWYSWPGYAELIELYFPTSYPSGNTPSGVPRALRKAMSYAFDYDTYINVALEGRAVQGSPIGVSNIFYDDTVPMATHDVTIARNALLDDPLMGYLCGLQGLDANSTDTDWHNAANSIGGKTPIWTLDFYWDDNFQVLKNVFQTSLEDIGVSLIDETGATNKLPTTMWTEIQSYWLTGFPVFSAHAWPLDWNIPRTIGEGWIESNFHDPTNGRWRVPPYDPGPDWFPWFNLAFTYNTTVDDWLKRMWLSNDTSKAEWINNIADHAANYQYPMIYVSQGMQGAVYWNEWELDFFWAGAISYHRIKYIGAGGGFPEIPGFLTFVVLITSIITMAGLIYTVRKKTVN